MHLEQLNSVDSIDNRIMEINDILSNQRGKAYEKANEKLEIEQLLLVSKKNELTILSEDGSYFDYIKYANSNLLDSAYQEVCADGSSLIYVTETYKDLLITKHDDIFSDCGECGKSKDKMEVQILNGGSVCLDCFEIECRNEFFNELIDDFTIHENIYHKAYETRYDFKNEYCRIYFDKIEFYKIGDKYNFHFFVIKNDLKIYVSHVEDIELTKQKIGFLTKYYPFEEKKI